MSARRAGLANNLWHLTCLPAARRFRQAARQVETVQTQRLRRYLSENKTTDYGRRYNFAAIASVAAYQGEVPLTTYDDYAADIEAIGQGRSGVLTTAAVQMFELSSGSSAASKLLPYTHTLKAEFQQAIAPWIADLFSHNPDLKRGPAYWSLTPLTRGRQFTPGGLPIGFEEDSAYLGSLGRWLLDAAMAVPNAVKHVADMDAFRYVTLLYLLRQKELRLMSVWNPTYLTTLLAPLRDWWPALLDDIAAGRLTPPQPLDPTLQQTLQRPLTPDRLRARSLAGLDPTDYKAIWPHLGLISCWLDGPAARYADPLVAQFPAVCLQGKGLIATEAFVSFPLSGVSGSVLAVTSHFFEFLPVNPTDQRSLTDRPLLAHQLDQGQTYEVIVTTGGGFYRYRLQDLIEVVGYLNRAPRLRFLGKTDLISDWFGEKLSAAFVEAVLTDLFTAHGLTPHFAMLAPNDSSPAFRYTLYLDLPHPNFDPIAVAAGLDTRLSRNFHYDYCRRLGQLAPASLTLVEDGLATYLRVGQSRGQRLGDIKPTPLQKTTGWERYFREVLLS